MDKKPKTDRSTGKPSKDVTPKPRKIVAKTRIVAMVDSKHTLKREQRAAYHSQVNAGKKHKKGRRG